MLRWPVCWPAVIEESRQAARLAADTVAESVLLRLRTKRTRQRSCLSGQAGCWGNHGESRHGAALRACTVRIQQFNTIGLTGKSAVSKLQCQSLIQQRLFLRDHVLYKRQKSPVLAG
jgi:hypothetical protein